MTVPRKLLVGAVVVLALLSLAYFARRTQLLSAEIARLQHDLAVSKQSAAVHAAEIETTRVAASSASHAKSTSELARLRAEVARLRTQSATGSNVITGTAPLPTNELRFPVPIVESWTKTSAPIKPGQTLITGGWPAGDGTRGFMLLSLENAENVAPGLMFRGAILEMTDSVRSALGLEGFDAGAAGETPSGLLDLDSGGTDAWVSALQTDPGVKVVSRPTVVAKPGQEATIFIGQQVPIANGKYAPVGLNIGLLPQETEDGITVSVTTKTSSAAPPP